MIFPDPDTYMLKLEACTFFIKRESPSSWLLSYHMPSGHYQYHRRCFTPRDCAALLRNPAANDHDWLNLNQRVQSLRLPENIFDLSTWVGVSDAPPR